MLSDLYTEKGAALAADSAKQPWPDYPRPSLKRSSFLNLNGLWHFTVRSSTAAAPAIFDGTIRVPFAPESLLSLVHAHFAEGSCFFYTKDITLPASFIKDRILLHIGAADQTADVFVNGTHCGTHTGGYTAVTFDITDALAPAGAEHSADYSRTAAARHSDTCEAGASICAHIVIRTRDDLRDKTLPYGKQKTKRGGMWYTPVSGIWQTVWLESVPSSYIKSLSIQTHLTDTTGKQLSAAPFADISVNDSTLNGTVTVNTGSAQENTALVLGKARITIHKPHYWTPGDPFIYRFTVKAGADTVESYFALRLLDIRNISGKARLCLNGKPFFFNGLLDQGWWSDGLYTAADPSCIKDDILTAKKCGFNMLRKHIKVEPELYYYYCDTLGMAVFQDMVNNGRYHFVRDTVLPTAGIQRLNDRLLNTNRRTRNAFLVSMTNTVTQLRNHPCICYWTVFNEGWGQFCGDKVYGAMRSLDDTRFIDTASGWFRVHRSDVDSRHVYFKPLHLSAGAKPLVLSEFGGYAWCPAEHRSNRERVYGYRNFSDRESYSAAVEKLYAEQVVPLVKEGLCAAVYTQLTDVEDETNGILTYDRRVLKVDPDKMRQAAEHLMQ